MAIPLPTKFIRGTLQSHKQRVLTLYKEALRQTQSYYPERHMFRYQAVLMRQRFDQNVGVVDMREAKKLLLDGEQELWDKHHPQRIRFPNCPGGVAYERNPKLGDQILDTWHPFEKAAYPYYFAKRDLRKKEHAERWEKKYGQKVDFGHEWKMPFLGRDWRSDGDIWVRTDHGWETLKNWRVKIHDNINYNVLQRILRQSIQQPEKSEELMECSKLAHYLHIPKIYPCRISNGQSLVMFTQVVSALDMAGAFKDTQRASYVYKLIEVLVNERLRNMSGAVQNQLFDLLEHAMAHAVKTGQNKSRLAAILENLLTSLKDYPYAFEHLGSQAQWSRNYNNVENMPKKVRAISVTERADDGGLKLTQLPYDVIRQILLYLCTQDDLINSGKASEEIEVLVSDNSLWRELCMCHFTSQQVNQYQRSNNKAKYQREYNWYRIYTKLYRRYGTIERYTDMLSWCSQCRLIFWKMTGHPCKHEEGDNQVKAEELTPSQLVSMFHV